MQDVSALLELLREKAREELARRATTPEYAELVREDILGRLHDKQRAVVALVEALTRFIAGECSRRAGKTFLAASLIVLCLLRAKRGQEVVFCAPTLLRGKDLIWDELTSLIEEYGLPWKTNASSGRIRTPNCAKFRIVGLDNKKQVGKISRGGNTIAFITDETQEYPHLLQPLLIAVRPALAQSRGVFLALGTPTKNEADYWAKVCDGASGFRREHWTMADNPYLGRPVQEIYAEELRDNGWTPDHPDFVREYMGKRCKDPSLLALEYSAANSIEVLTGYWPDAYTLDLATDEQKRRFERERPGWLYANWRHFIGIDFGHVTAFVVLAAHATSGEVTVVHADQFEGMTWDDVADHAKLLCDVYRPQGLVGDSATGGAQFLLTFNARYGGKLGVIARQATKHDKMSSISVMNTELRKLRMRVLLTTGEEARARFKRLPPPGLTPEKDKDGTRCLVAEATALQKDPEDPTKILEGDAYPDHKFDAWHYAFRDFWAWLHPPEEKAADSEEDRIRERNERERRRQATASRLARR